MASQLLQYATVVAAGVGALLAGASTVHYFQAPDLTLPPPPAHLARRLRAAEEKQAEAAAAAASAASIAKAGRS
jgi:hypothetical protein